MHLQCMYCRYLWLFSFIFIFLFWFHFISFRCSFSVRIILKLHTFIKFNKIQFVQCTHCDICVDSTKQRFIIIFTSSPCRMFCTISIIFLPLIPSLKLFSHCLCLYSLYVHVFWCDFFQRAVCIYIHIMVSL